MNKLYPLTPCQLLLWRSQRTSPNCPLFNQVVSIDLPSTDTPEQDAQLWAQAWRAVQKLHPVLTARISHTEDDAPAQRATDQHTELRIVQLGQAVSGNGESGLPDQVHDRDWNREQEQDQNNVFNAWINSNKQNCLSTDNALTDIAYLYDHQDNSKARSVLYINVHHLLADAWSTVLICEALERSFWQLQNPSVAPGITTTLKPDIHADANSEANPETNSGAKPGSLAASQSTTPLNFLDYLSRTRWPDSAEAMPSDALELTPPAYYGHINNDPTTRSERQCLPLSRDELQQLTTITVNAQTGFAGAGWQQSVLHLAVYAIYLHQVTRDSNIVIEMPLLGRAGKTWLGVAGNFIEMVQVSMTLSAHNTFSDVHAHARDALMDALKVAGPGCTAKLQARTVHGVLNVITAHTQTEQSTTDNKAATLTWHHPGHSDMRHPLRLHVADWNNTGIPSIELDINHGFIRTEQRSRVPHHLAATYRALLADPQCRIDSLSLLAPEECWMLSGAAAVSDSTSQQLLYQHVTQRARQTPDAKALIENDDYVSYKTLLQQAEYVQQHMQAHGIQPGDRVAVYLPRSLALPIVLLGLVGRGISYIPIDISQPEHRVDAILRDADVKAVIVEQTDNREAAINRTAEIDKRQDQSQQQESVISQLPKMVVGDLLVPVDSMANASPDNSPPPKACDIAYIMYTSGSTGTPKGVSVSQGALMAYLGWATHYYRLPDAAISMPLFTSVGFDLTVTSLYLPWMSGGTLHVCSQSDSTDALSLFSVINNPAINTIKLTPAHLALLLESDVKIDHARQLIVGGEDLKCSTASAVQARAPHPLTIVNEYGPTEATVGCITRIWQTADSTGSVPIGQPINGMHACVFDESGRPQFEGVAGELFLAGHSLADGYWNDSRKTTESFVTREAMKDQRLYRTGDLVRIQNGELVYLGRKDTQVSLNGHRVELSEIESALMEHPAISHCVVQLEKATTGKQNIPTAALPAHSEGSATTDNSDEHLCVMCGLSSRYPGADIDEQGSCSLCRSYLPNKERVNDYFRSKEDLHTLTLELKARRRGNYDAVVLLSGGKDSTYSLCQLVDMGLSVYAFSLDNGYLSPQALANIDAVCEKLGVDHHYARTQHMDAIFHDSLTRYSNVCHGCFKTIYNLAMEFAAKHKIDTIFTGLSRGQLFETRLNNELFSEKDIPLKKIEDMVVAARVQYHSIKDAPNTLLGIPLVNDGTLPASIDIVDFYRYWDVEMSDMLSYLKTRIDWVRPPDTGRSTNCLINDVGIHVHKQEQGFHNYALPYSWDVRLGHKARDEAIEELDDDINAERVESILSGIGYQLHTVEQTEPDTVQVDGQRIEAIFTTLAPLDISGLRHWLQDRLPAYMQPALLRQVSSLPLNLHGKVDREQIAALAAIADDDIAREQATPLTPTEQQIATLWAPYVVVKHISRDDNFFQLGGDSQAAIRCVMQLRKQGYAVDPADLFRKPVLNRFAKYLDSAARIEPVDVAPVADKFSHLSDVQREKLAKLLNRSKGASSAPSSS